VYKNNVEVYSKQGVLSVPMQEENTNSGGKQGEKRVTFCKENRRWPFDDWKKGDFSDESQIVIGNDNRVYIWGKSEETFPPECICPDINRKISVMIWGYITYNGVCTLTKNDGTLHAAKYVESGEKIKFG